ncbi:methionine gamma-lyase [Acetatifactor muris]|uniref:Methionine gamma-lyase n=2 Tax=Acetatifactor muris TaxID=879566 RepID=A0A2K4ZJJ3_9FIRM|nr:methionine gamma-lyase family protein [Acetatifactor muris]SOY30654.1 methionine gamma-lyase [Acetatifactor muris]
MTEMTGHRQRRSEKAGQRGLRKVDVKMNDIEKMYESMGIDTEVYAYGKSVLEELEERFRAVDETADYNQLKVLKAMQECQVSEACLLGTSGYGYNDLGRETLEAVYAKVFRTEDALVRPQITCGTHALALALMSNLRPGDELLSPVGKPYDTLEEVIGIRPSKGSLAEYGITYRQVDLLPDGGFDYEDIEKAITERTRLVTIQRSKGYQTRPTLSVRQIGELISFIKRIRPDIICMVDNCYGEFVENAEPGEVGADMVVGSLIKNPGGGLAPVGGYIAGKRQCVENAAYRLTSPGLGKEVGASLDILRSFYQGLFLAPTVTASALKGAIFAARLYERLGYDVVPNGSESRHDIIQAVTFGSPESVIAFCQGIQAAAPVDSHVTPEAWDMPGYDSQVIMAAGAFVSGSSIELSADAPIKPPYAVYFQGGLTWPHARFGILKSLQTLVNRGLVDRSLLKR